MIDRSQIENPIKIRMPRTMTIEFPTIDIADCIFGDRRLWPSPLKPARSVCQDRDAQNAPAMKSRISFKNEVVPALSPRINAVKYVTVNGFNSVNPKNAQYVGK
jgi:hypothetical protein